MDKYFICLANSYKHGGRCVAGIEVLWDGEKSKVVRDQSGAAKWIRPVSKETTTGEIPTHQASHINVLDVVRLEGVVFSEDDFHRQALCDNLATTPALYGR